ncbi:MAG: hypothetical protein ACJ754_18315 [Pyrinomonadaceae bacterium]
MVTYHMVKVVKRTERERLGQKAAGGASLQKPSRCEARELAATVKEWITEFELARPVRLQELRRQLGWPEIEEDGRMVLAVSDSVESGK